MESVVHIQDFAGRAAVIDRPPLRPQLFNESTFHESDRLNSYEIHVRETLPEWHSIQADTIFVVYSDNVTFYARLVLKLKFLKRTSKFEIQAVFPAATSFMKSLSPGLEMLTF